MPVKYCEISVTADALAGFVTTGRIGVSMLGGAMRGRVTLAEVMHSAWRFAVCENRRKSA